MPRKSVAGNIVRKSAAEIPAASRLDLDRLHVAMRGSINADEIPERRKGHRVKRDASGRIRPWKGMIRDAVARQMRQRQITVYRLWQMGRAHDPALSQSAVREFLEGRRHLELPSIEALLAAVRLRLVAKP